MNTYSERQAAMLRALTEAVREGGVGELISSANTDQYNNLLAALFTATTKRDNLTLAEVGVAMLNIIEQAGKDQFQPMSLKTVSVLMADNEVDEDGIPL